MKLQKVLLGVAAIGIALASFTTPSQAATTSTEYLNGLLAGSNSTGTTSFIVQKDLSSTQLPDSGFMTSWSPDGSKLALVSADGLSIEILDEGGMSSYSTIDIGSYVSMPTWSPDSSKLAFVRSAEDPEDGMVSVLMTANADGTNVQEISDPDTNNDNRPKWSPAGDKILFVSKVASEAYQDFLYTMNPDGSNRVRTVTETVSTSSQPSWSPDGSKILYTALAPDSEQIFTVNPNGSGKFAVTNTPEMNIYDPSWSPDGTKIAFAGSDPLGESANYDVYTINADGTNQQQRTSGVYADQPYFSPDGKKIAYIVLGVVGDIYIMNADGSNKQLAIADGYYGGTGKSSPWQPRPYTRTVDDDGFIRSTISSSSEYTNTSASVVDDETLVLDGALNDVTVQPGGALSGNGEAAEVVIPTAGRLAPGPVSDPGCLSTGDTELHGTFELEFGGTTACSEHDQLDVDGTVDLTNAVPGVTLVDGFEPAEGDSFIVIDNDGSDPVSGTFEDLPEGAEFERGGATFSVSYLGGDGNDVVFQLAGVTENPGEEEEEPGTGSGNNAGSGSTQGNTPGTPDSGAGTSLLWAALAVPAIAATLYFAKRRFAPQAVTTRQRPHSRK